MCWAITTTLSKVIHRICFACWKCKTVWHLSICIAIRVTDKLGQSWAKLSTGLAQNVDCYDEGPKDLNLLDNLNLFPIFLQIFLLVIGWKQVEYQMSLIVFNNSMKKTLKLGFGRQPQHKSNFFLNICFLGWYKLIYRKSAS